jgi:Zinc carboxypeptidase.
MRFTHWLLPVFILVGMIVPSASAQKIDEVYNQKIKEHTTDPKFLPTSVLNVVDHPTIPSPLKFFGTIIGEPGVMHRTTDIYRYYQKLSETSPLLKMQQVGTTEEGRPIHLIIIANDDGLKRVDHYKNQLALLADPRKVNPADVSKIIGDSKPIFYLNGGLHSPEMGSPEMLMETGQSVSHRPERCDQKYFEQHHCVD